MRVLHVELGRHLYGGARQVAYLLNGLPELGGEHTLVAAEGAELLPAVEHSAVRVLPMRFGGDMDLGFIGRLRAVIRQFRPDLMHIHSRRGDLLSALAGQWAGVPMIHSRRVDNPPRWLDVRVKFPRFRRIVTISEGIRTVLIQAGVPGERVVCVPSAVDTDTYRPAGDRGYMRTALGLEDDRPSIGMIAQFIARKGHDVLFDALPQVFKRQPQARVLVFGRGPLEAELRAAVKQKGWDDRVRMIGFRSDIAQILPCLDVIVHPARMEGLGVALLEAAACGVPIVATAVGGIPEIVRDSVNGYLIEPGDSAGLADRLIRILGDAELRRTLGEAGRRVTLERYSVERMVAGNFRLYEKLLGAEPGGGR